MPDPKLVLGWCFLPAVFSLMWLDLGLRIAAGEPCVGDGGTVL